MIITRDEAFNYYFHFMSERMNVFWAKYEKKLKPLTNDGIILDHKFTNVYRASDRVSQYLIKNVAYSEKNKYLNEEDIILRILIFKVFNKIETWEYLESRMGLITLKNFSVEKLSILLTEKIKLSPIFNSAYLMTGFHRDYLNFPSKHERWLRMIKKEIVSERRLVKIIKSKSLEQVYNTLRECTFIGEFLAYQYAIDFNYSEVINFNENSFVKAGIGAIRGIKKCFINCDKYSFDDIIRHTYDNLDDYREKFNKKQFRNLFGREPTLIDLQNCFCETDKYLRVKMPQLAIANVRIKQKYKKNYSKIDFYFPPKWDINKNIK